MLLAQLHKQYECEGLVVVDIFHPKPARSIADLDTESVNKAAREMGDSFSIAVDADRGVLRRCWLDGGHGKRAFSSPVF